MCTSWSEFRDDLCFILRTGHSIRQFKNLRRLLSGSFSGPEDVVAFLLSRETSGDERDALLRALVSRVQSHASDADIAFAILALGRWQDLDQIFRRRFKRFPHDVEELVSLIRVGLTTAVLRADLSKTRNVAVNLSLSTERLVSESSSKAWRTNQVMTHPEHGVESIADGGYVGESSFGLPIAMSEETRSAHVYGLAREAAGDDVDLIIAVDVVGEDLADVAAESGISYALARKRYWRAKGKIKKAFEKNGLDPRPRNATTPATTDREGDVRPGGL